MGQNAFANFDASLTYTWHRNHDSPDGEDAIGRERQLQREASTAGVIGGSVVQQGDDGPLKLTLKGKIWHLAQFEAMWDWYKLSRTETILFTNFDGDQFEVIITSFQPKKVGLLRNTVDPGNCPTWRWDYTLAMEIFQIFNGPMAGRAD